jgi:predicted ATPase/DNA-binding CsgD family transcriptional regulator/transcriptional regulator with XRE-family HTH domain
MNELQAFGDWLKQRRRALDFTQHSLAQQVGCTTETIRKIEAAKLRPSRALAQRLVTALGVPLDAQSSVVALARARTVEESPGQQWLAPASDTQRRTSSASLKMPRTSLVGRETDVARLTTLLRDQHVRHVTLTGPPGVGKTRLAIEVATVLATHFAAEVRFVALAALAHTDAVLPTIGEALNLVSLAADDVEQTLVAALRERPILLVLDNMEHLRGAARQLARLLDGAPLLKLLVTSRTPLHLTGEQLWSVAPLAVHAPATEGASPAVELFVQRARAIWQDYTLQDHNIATIATLCARLDGLPLAIELAAARSAVLSPETLLRRFEEHLDLLTSSPVDADTRHQTLRHAIGWSYALLDTNEQALLRCLSVFEGGCRLEMVQAVYEAAETQNVRADEDVLLSQPSNSLLDRLTVLIEHNLVEQHSDLDGEPRFTLLATIHAFAHEQAQAAGEVTLLAERHAYAYAALLEWVEPQLHGPAQQQWFTLLDSELHNLRAALMWSQTDAGDSVLGLRLATTLTTFWEVRGSFHEGWSWLERALTHAATAPAALRALALAHASRFANALGKVAQARMDAEACLNTADGVDERARAIAIGILGDQVRVEGNYERAYDYFSTSLDLARAVGDHVQQTLMLERLGRCVFVQGHKQAASEWYEQSRDVSERHGNVRGVARALNWLGLLAVEERAYERGAKLLQESLVRARALGYKSVVGMALIHLGELARLQGHYLQAMGYYEQNRVVAQEMGNGSQLAMASFNVGQVALQLEDATRALAAFDQSLAFWCESNFHEYVIMALAGYAGALRLRGQFTEAARLLGAATALRESLGVVFATPDQAAYERDIAGVRAHLGDAMFQAAWRAGEALSLEGAVAEAHAQTAAAKGTTSSHTAHFPANLTIREVEVLQLLAHGLTNAEIAQRLVISPRTVNTHLTTIYRKLRVSSRSAATRFAVQHGLI